MKFDYKLYRMQDENMLAISDSSIIGKTFQQGEIRITVSREFYSGDRCGEKEALLLIRKSTIVNAIGKSIVSLMIKEKLVDENKVIVVQGIPHAQIIVIK